MINIQVLNHAAQNGLNVILKGKHGVGKTALVRSAFNNVFGEQNEDWLYFSASTMDPWVDFIGVPKEKNGALELVRPRVMQDDKIQGIFFDELNRSHKKIRNAIMELIQFKSINGKTFPNLKVIWAAINPDDDEDLTYDVEKLDPAQLDRFELHIDVPYQPDIEFFRNTYGGRGELAVKWWLNQNEPAQAAVSPRRLEYALQVLEMEGDIRYVLGATKTVNVSEFVKFIQRGDPVQCLRDLQKKSEAEQRAYLGDANSFKHVKNELLRSKEFLREFAHLLPDEELLTELRPRQRRSNVAPFVVENIDKFDHLLPSIVSNADAYRREVYNAFVKYQERQNKKNLPRASSTPDKRKPAGKLDIKGVQWSPGDINVCFTGSLQGWTREDATRLVEGIGCRTTNSINNSTTHLVAGDRTGSTKMSAASRFGVTVLTEDEFVAIFASPAGKGDPKVEIDGKLFLVSELTVDNFLEKTGRRFRATGEQCERLRNNTLTREEAFAEYLDDLLNNSN